MVMDQAPIRVALWTPLPPQKTGIADYVADLLPALTAQWDIEIFIDEGVLPQRRLSDRYQIFPHTAFPAREAHKPFNLHLYQMGNNHFHWFIYQQALRVPGVVVLHDVSLAYMLYDALVGREAAWDVFIEELRYAEGEEAAAQFTRYFNAGDHQGVMQFFSQHPMLRRLAERSYAFVTHLEYNAERLRKQYPQIPLIRSMHLAVKDPYEEVENTDAEAWRARLGFTPDEFVVASFGFLQPTKQNDVTIKAFAQLVRTYPQARLVFVGELNSSGGYDEYLRSLVRRLGLSKFVTFTGFVSRQKMLHYLLASDVVVNLRFPSFGEMSASLARAVAAGKPVIVTDLPEWRFLPETFCLRVPPQEGASEQLAEHLSLLAHDHTIRQQMGNAAREYYQTYGTPAQAASHLDQIAHEVLEQVIPRSALRPSDEDPMPPLEVRLQRQIQQHLANWTRSLQAGGWGQRLQRYRHWPVVGPLLYGLYRAWHHIRFYRSERQAFINLQLTLLNSTLQMLDLQRTQRSILTWQTFPPIRIVEQPLQALEILSPAASMVHLKPWLDAQTDTSRNNDPLPHQEHFYHALEDTFRGSLDTIRSRQALVWQSLEPLLPDSPAPILDVGCGRGEFLRLVSEQKIPAYGIELDTGRVEILQSQGYKVYREDALNHLRACAPASLRAIVAFHVVEHLPFEYLMALLVAAKKALIPGGLLYFETPNALSFATTGDFYTDPTHRHPIPPYFLAFLLHYAGFEVPQMLFLEPEPAFGKWSHEQWMRYYRDYGVIGRKKEA